MTAPAAFSVVPFPGTDNLPPPTNGPYVVAGKSGYYVHRDFHFGRILVPIGETPFLPDITPTIWHDIAIPHQILGQALSFFTAVYNSRKSEAMVDIIYDPNPERRAARRQRQGWDDSGYRLFVPPQQTTGSSVKATRTPEHYTGQMVGTIHSHCNFGAFHSGTDTHDADGHDGLHITIGDVLTTPSIAIMISVAKTHFNFELDDITDGPLKPYPHPVWWERYVEDPKPGFTKTWKPAAASSPTTTKPTTTSDSNLVNISSAHLEILLDEIYTPAAKDDLDDAQELYDALLTTLDSLGIEMTARFSFADDTNELLSLREEEWLRQMSEDDEYFNAMHDARFPITTTERSQ